MNACQTADNLRNAKGRLRRWLIGCFTVITTSSVAAHETWILPDKFIVPSDTEVKFEVTSGMEFPRLEAPVRIERIASARYRLNDRTHSLTNLETKSNSLVVRQAFPADGVATLSIDLKPYEITLKGDTVEHYLEEIDASNEIRSQWADQIGRYPWKEQYTKHAKTFVAIGNIENDESWRKSIGSALEIVPTTNPFQVIAGKEFTVELQSDSRLLADVSIGLIMARDKKRAFRRTNDEGKATFRMERPGHAMLFAVHLRFDESSHMWISDFCNLTIHVRPEKRKSL